MKNNIIDFDNIIQKYLLYDFYGNVVDYNFNYNQNIIEVNINASYGIYYLIMYNFNIVQIIKLLVIE